MSPIRRAGLSALLLGLAAASVPLWAQAPKTLEQVPVYPGAARQPAKEAEEAEPSPTPTPGMDAMMSETVRIYTVNAGLEDVTRFYQQRLQAREIRTDADRDRVVPESEKLAVGQTSTVWLEVTPANLNPDAFGERASGNRSAAQLAAAARAVYQRTRPTPFRPNEWLLSATLDWEVKASASQDLKFTIALHDTEDFAILEPSYHNETQIEFTVQVWRAAAAEAAPQGRPSAAPMGAPAESELGVPLYPGARFDGQMSAALSASDPGGNYYVYTSADPPQQIATFYQARTGKRGTTTEGGTLIAVKGEGLFPDLGVTVQPNTGTYPPNVKTMLTIRKRKQT